MTDQATNPTAAGGSPLDGGVRPRDDRYSELADALGCDPMDSHASRVDRARVMRIEIGQLRHALAESGKLAEDRLAQMKTDRAEFLAQRRKLYRALTVCSCAVRVVDSSAYQGVSDEDCDLESAVRNWQQLGS